MDKKQRLIDLFSSCEDGILYMLLVAAISADNNNTIEEIDANLENLDAYEEAIKECTRDEEMKKKLLDFVTSGKDILERDKKDFESNLNS